MASIGFATLEIIPSLKGVTDAINKQVEGKVVNVTIEPQVDKRATEQAGRQAKQTVEKHTKEVSVEPKVDQASAKKAGKEAGETVTKEVTDAVRKGNIGKTVGDEVASSSTSSAAKKAAKVLVDGIADGVKSELPQGGIGQVFVDGLADGIKQGIDAGAGGQIAATIGEGIRSGNLGGAIRDAVMPAIENIGQDIRSGVSTWATGIADSLRSGDIQGATTEIATTVQNTTDLIADIGDTFGLQLDGVRDFGNTAVDTLSTVGGDIQKVVDKANNVGTTLTDVGTMLETVLPGKTGKGVASMIAELGKLAGPIAAVNAAVDALPKELQGIAASTVPGVLPSFKDQGQDKPWWQREITADVWRWLQGRGKSSGGYTGNMATDQIAGVVHGGEYVIKASSTAGIENAMPGLLDYLNNRGALPGFQGGGKVQLGNISGPGITTAEQQSMWDAVRGKFPSAILSSATRTVMTEGHADWHNAGRAIDISGPNMGAIAAWIASTYPDSLELIHHPFSRNIKNGKNVGDGMSFYGANTMAGHRDHVHWALGKSAAMPTSSDMLSAIIPAATAPATTTPAPTSAPTTTTSQSTSMSLPGSLSRLASMGVSGLGAGVGETSSGSDLNLFGQAAGAAIEGQVASALGVFGINDSPGWLQGLSQIASGITIGGDSVAPVAAAPRAVTPPAMNSVHSGSGAQPGPGVVYNINAWETEAAFLQAKQQESERTAAKLARF